MRRSAWLRFGLASLVVIGGGSAVALVGCGDDTTSPANSTDSGGGNDGSNTDSGGTDSGGGDGGGGDSGNDAGPPHAKAIVVHASADTNIGAVRVCFGLKKTGTASFVIPPLLALPDKAAAGQPYAGLFPGTGGPLPDLLDLIDYDIQPYIVPAALIKNDAKGVDGGTPRTCQDLLTPGDAGLTAGEYVTLPVIPAGTFQHGVTLLLAITGCDKNAAAGDQPVCGSGYNVTTGNIAAHIYSLTRTTGAAMGAQFTHLSTGAQALGAVYPFVAQADGGNLQVINPGTPESFGDIAPDGGQTQLMGVDPAGSVFGIASPSLLDGSAPGTQLGAAPLPLVQALTIGSTTPADYFKNGQNYTFVVLGRPDQSVDAGSGQPPNGYAIHFLGFNNNPALPAP